MALDVETDVQHRLLEGLLGEKHREAYMTNAAFHHHMDMLVRTLPLWVDGIASACDVAEAEQREVERLMRTVAYQFPITPEALAEFRGQPSGRDSLTGPDTPDCTDDH